MDQEKHVGPSADEETERLVSAIEKLERSASSIRLWLKLIFAALIVVWFTIMFGDLFVPALIGRFL